MSSKADILAFLDSKFSKIKPKKKKKTEPINNEEKESIEPDGIV